MSSDIEKAYSALEIAMERCAALQTELSEKAEHEKAGRFMRSFELLDLMEQSLTQAATAIKAINEVKK